MDSNFEEIVREYVKGNSWNYLFSIQELISLAKQAAQTAGNGRAFFNEFDSLIHKTAIIEGRHSLYWRQRNERN